MHILGETGLLENPRGTVRHPGSAPNISGGGSKIRDLHHPIFVQSLPICEPPHTQPMTLGPTSRSAPMPEWEYKELKLCNKTRNIDEIHLLNDYVRASGCYSRSLPPTWRSSNDQQAPRQPQKYHTSPQACADLCRWNSRSAPPGNFARCGASLRAGHEVRQRCVAVRLRISVRNPDRLVLECWTSWGRTSGYNAIRLSATHLGPNWVRFGDAGVDAVEAKSVVRRVSARRGILTGRADG
jgi:hypothetical protein